MEEIQQKFAYICIMIFEGHNHF